MTSPNFSPEPPPLPEENGHEWVRENFAAYLAGGLDAFECTQIELHLAGCAECAAFAGEMKQMEQSLAAMFADVRIDGIEERIISNLRENAVKKNARYVLVKRVGFGIAAALVLGATGVMADYAVRHDLLSGARTSQVASNRVHTKASATQIAVVDASRSMKGDVDRFDQAYQKKVDEPNAPKAQESAYFLMDSNALLNELEKTHEGQAGKVSVGAGVSSNSGLVGQASLEQKNFDFNTKLANARDTATLADTADKNWSEAHNWNTADSGGFNYTDGTARSGGLTKSGAGTWTLTGLNTYSGGTNVTAGTLSTSSQSLTKVGSGTLTLGSNSALGTGGSLTLNGANTHTGGTTISGTGNVNFDNAATAATYRVGGLSTSRTLDTNGNNVTLSSGGTLDMPVMENQLAVRLERNVSDLSNTSAVLDQMKKGIANETEFGGTTGDYYGKTSIQNGTLITGKLSTGNGQDSVTVPTGGKLMLGGQNVGSGNVTFNSGTLTYAAGNTATFGGFVSGVGGTVGNTSVTLKNGAAKADIAADLAEKTAQAGDLRKAKEMLGEALKADPNNAELKAKIKVTEDSLAYQDFTKKNSGDRVTRRYLTLGDNYADGDGKKDKIAEQKSHGEGARIEGETEVEYNDRIKRSVTETVRQIPDDVAQILLIDKPIRLSGQPIAATQAATPATQPAAINGPAPERRLTPEQIAQRKIIRNGTVEYEVRNFDDTQVTVMRLVEEEGGFVASTNSDRLANGKMRGVMVLRVPPDRLDTLILKLRGVGDLKAQQIGSSDVSKQYTDMESKLRALRAMEARLIEIIKTGNGDVKQLVEAETKLNENRQQIEQIVGELKYYDNLVAMATLTVSAYEKDIRQAAAIIETERSDIGIETEDVETKYQAARKIIDDAKGRIVSSALKRLEGDQVNAQIVCRVSQDAAGPVLDQFRQLGRVARFTRDKVLQSDPNANAATVVKTETRDAEIQISLYNLANVPPRETTYVTVAVPDVQEMFNKVLEAVRAESASEKAEDRTIKVLAVTGKVINSSLSGQKAEQMSATISANVRAADFMRVMELIKKGGGVTEEVLSASIVTSSDVAGTTLEKKGIQLTLQSTANVQPRETLNMNVAVPDVQAVYDKLLEAVNQPTAVDATEKTSPMLPTGRVVSSSIAGQRVDQMSAGVTAYIRATEFKRIVELIKTASGGNDETLAQSTSVSSDTSNTSIAKRGLSISLQSTASVLPRETFMLNIAATNVKELREKIKKLESVGVRILGDTFNEPNARDVNAGMRLQVPQDQIKTVDALFASAGVAELTRTAQRSEDGSRTTRKVAYEISIVSAEALSPIRETILLIETNNVNEAMEKLRKAGGVVNAREIDSLRKREDDGSEMGQMVLDVPVMAAMDVADVARQQGDIKGSTVRKLSSITESALSRDRVSVRFTSKPPLASGSKFSGTMHNSLDNALTVLLTVLGWLLMGAIVLTPVGIIWLIVRKIIRSRAVVAAPVKA